MVTDPLLRRKHSGAMVGCMRAPLSAVSPVAALAREWLLRNDRGDLASGTASGLQVRLRHAAFATADPPARPVPKLLRLDARAENGHQVYALSWRESDASAPMSSRARIESFVRDPWPTWQYRAGETLLEKQLLLVHDHAALVAVWRHLEGPALRIAVTPAVASGMAAALPADEPSTVQAIPGRVRLGDPNGHRLTLWHDGAFLPVRSWRNALDGAADAETYLAPRDRGDVPAPKNPRGRLVN